MTLPKRYNPRTREPHLQAQWLEQGTYYFDPESDKPRFTIDTPPPTVSGHLHLGHTYSYSHTDFIARFWRMRGYNVYYPMGYDDNGLPTERLVEQRENITASEIGRSAFIERCLAVSEEAEKDYEALWQRLGLSIDWRYSYRTIDDLSRRTAQWSFLDLYKKGLAYRRQAPSIWCTECQTAIAQAEVDDLARESIFYTLAFSLDNGTTLPIATTRPELLPACVSIFIHPDDPRAADLLGQEATVPYFGQRVPILADPQADPQKGTGIVMCCTFGDTTDVAWWRTHELPLIELIGKDGKLGDPAGAFANLTIPQARQQIIQTLDERDLLLDQKPTQQTVQTHERCDTPIEFILTHQWFIRVLDHKQAFLDIGETIEWHPAHMKARYRQWVENLNWDWCISRQRYFGITFPVWYCDQCGHIALADESQLPIDPSDTAPPSACTQCGGTQFTPEQDVMDTWFTSSLTPEIVGQFFANKSLYEQASPFTLRPQAHDIIRTWAFYTIVKSYFHFDKTPWKHIALSGWGLAGEGLPKMSKSRGGGPMSPMDMIEAYSADALRYWTSSTGLGKDSIIDETKIQAGTKLINKLWNVARFCSRFLANDSLAEQPTLTPADRWILHRTQERIQRTTLLFERYDYASAKAELEAFFWHDLADNYLEMAKQRLYDGGTASDGAIFALHHALLTTIKLFAPFFPYVTEAIYQGVFDPAGSIHQSTWPTLTPDWYNPTLNQIGDSLLHIATTIRRYKSETNLSLGAEIPELHLATSDEQLLGYLREAKSDIGSITRAVNITIGAESRPGLEILHSNGTISIGLENN